MSGVSDFEEVLGDEFASPKLLPLIDGNRLRAKARRLEHELEFVLLDQERKEAGSERVRSTDELKEILENAWGIEQLARAILAGAEGQDEQLLDCLLEYLEPEESRPHPLGLLVMSPAYWGTISDALVEWLSPAFYNALQARSDYKL